MNKEDLRQIKGIIDESLETHTLKCIKPAFDDVYNRFDKMDKRFDKMDRRFDKMDKRFDKMDRRFDKMGKRMNHTENQAVTKDYLDEKMADLKGDAVVRDRKIDEKANIANNSLKRGNLLTAKEEKRIEELQVFPSLDQLRQSLSRA